MTDIQARLYTVDDLLHVPDHGKRYELIRGEMIEMSPTNGIHGILTLELATFIRNHIRRNKLGQVFAAETGFLVSTSPDTVLAPDIAFISAARTKPLTEKFVTVAPDLVVEVISPGNTAGEMNEKTSLYFQAGTQQVWIVYPKTQTLYRYTSITNVTILTRNDNLDGGSFLPDFNLLLEELFSVLDN
jgi:Uma2 family endonuclease